MTCLTLKNPVVGIAGHICMADEVHTLRVRGKPVTFELHRIFGPIVLTKDGSVRSRQPGARNPFWPAFERWQKRTARLR